MKGIGIDMVEVPRMRAILKENRSRFLNSTFTKREQEYCKSYKDPAVHFAGTFAAKEAVRKASGALSLSFAQTEIRRTKDGKPEVWLKNKYKKNLLVSITHTRTQAHAVALNI